MQVHTHEMVLDRSTNINSNRSVVGLQLGGSLDQSDDILIQVMYMDSLPLTHCLSTIMKMLDTASGQSVSHYFQLQKIRSSLSNVPLKYI